MSGHLRPEYQQDSQSPAPEHPAGLALYRHLLRSDAVAEPTPDLRNYAHTGRHRLRYAREDQRGSELSEQRYCPGRGLCESHQKSTIMVSDGKGLWARGRHLAELSADGVGPCASSPLQSINDTVSLVRLTDCAQLAAPVSHRRAQVLPSSRFQRLRVSGESSHLICLSSRTRVSSARSSHDACQVPRAPAAATLPIARSWRDGTAGSLRDWRSRCSVQGAGSKGRAGSGAGRAWRVVWCIIGQSHA